ncbi:hypothetical protein [Streptosporangium roseum]|nr:hypothetical protein [Streptosporangium roseum]
MATEYAIMIKGTLRIVFTGEDLTRVRIAGRADMMWEMALSLHILQRPGGASALSGWRRQANKYAGMVMTL